MNTDIELRDGERHDITITPISRRVVHAEGTLVRRLLVEDETGQRRSLLAAPDSDTLLQLKTGGSYRVTGLLGARPPTGGSAEGTCPSCGARLRPGATTDAVDPALTRAAERLDVTAPFGVIDARTVVTRLREDGATVDDWRPMTGADPVAAPDLVCEECGRHLDAAEVRRDDGSTPAEVHLDPMADRAMDAAPAMAESAAPAADTVGLATGGAKDVENFRENVAAGYTPQPEAISDEGLFYDYHFETGERTGTDALFAPRYATAVSEHPLTGETERYLSVGLDSTLSTADFERPRLDLVAVLDVSGSMEESFDDYYYDEHGRERAAEGGDGAETKLEAAVRSLCALTEQLRPDDRLGVVLYNHRAHVAKPLRAVGDTNMVAIRQHVREVAAGGGTNLADGFEAAWDMLADGETTADRERRVVFVTDAMPNTGTTDERDLTRLFADAADRGIHTTFVGVGLDANAELVDALSSVRGANHYFVHSAAEFERRLGAEFEYVVTPLVYDLGLELDAEGYEIAAVHGSPSGDAATDRLLHVTTLFPSAKSDGEARGGVVLVRLAEHDPDGDLELVASWTERDGTERAERASVDVPSDPETFDHDGVRKAVALARYARELRSWAREVHERADAAGVDDWLLADRRGEHERESVPLSVPGDYAARFERLAAYLEREQDALDEPGFRRELSLLETLAAPEVAHEGVPD